ncbi:hypothetical protein pb186bvf_005004 [Paramecium bursaria]
MINSAGRQKQHGLQQIRLSHQKCRIDEDLFELEKEQFLIKLEIFKAQKTSIPQMESIQTTLIPSDISCISKPIKSILKKGSTFKQKSYAVRFRN